MKTRFYIKSFAVFFTLTLLFQILAPTTVWALTGGPSQPEVNSFEPIGTTQMVDLASGDFTYNIPLMTIPGPNGGYPINLAYHSGIGMEQEASWVGLGWNINVGAINRQMRGIPDDFKGDEIKRKINIRNNFTVGLGIAANPVELKKDFELLGFDFSILSQNYQIYYNNYRGIGLKASFGLSESVTSESNAQSDKSKNSIIGSMGFSFDSQSGLEFTPSLAFGKTTQERAKWWTTSATFHSRQGLIDLNLQRDLPLRTKSKENKRSKSKSNRRWSIRGSGPGAGVDFARTSYVPGVSTPMKGFSGAFNLKLGTVSEAIEFNPKLNVNGVFSVNKLKGNERNLGAYGTFYLEDRHYTLDSTSVMDYNYDKDFSVTKRAPAIPMPVRTHDIFSISGQGISGTFRGVRSDIGMLLPETSTSKLTSLSLGFEFGKDIVPLNPNIHVGVNAGLGFNTSYSGRWQKNADHLEYLKYRGNNPGYLYEAFCFKPNGEQLASPTNHLSYINGTNPLAFEMGLKWQGISAKPMVHKTHSPGGPSYQISQTTQPERTKRSQSIEYRTIHEIKNDEYYSSRGYHIYDFDDFPGINYSSYSSSNQINYGVSYMKSHHIGEVSVLNPDGNRYIYGLPAYNTVHRDVVFTLDVTGGPNEFETPRTISYNTSTDPTIDNDNGEDHYYSSTETPPYSHAHLLTCVVSSDYVDLTGNGPSEDDFGYYTKFNYSKINTYKWRVPYYDANYSKGYYSNTLDDKGSYSYGEKEIFYINSVETKTHIAVFELGDRNDGYGVNGEGHTGTSYGSTPLKYLKAITLYSKADPSTPILKVNFVYNYELCTGVLNNPSSAGSQDEGHELADEGGKLTLKKVYFTQLGNQKGSITPYEFTYGYNPTYSINKMDRWGNYQPDNDYSSGDQYYVNSENPYTAQEAYHTGRDNWASAWNLSQIILPSGGNINIEYEPDDYGYVQDKRAMQMCRIVGVQDVDESVLPGSNLMDTDSTLNDPDANNILRKNNRRIYFELESDVSSNSEVQEYVKGIQDVYFKTWQILKRKQVENVESLDFAEDYVEGYARIAYQNGLPKAGKANTGTTNVGYVELEPVNYRKNVGGSGRVAHPFRKAGWQYLKFQRPDLFFNPNYSSDEDEQVIAFIISNVLTIIREALTLATGYYNYANMSQYNKKLNLQRKPSYLRLNSPDFIKHGGGCRVKKISMSDNWTEEGASVYGQTYEYRTEDGKSSGVADYEPIIGGEENPFRKPVWYNGNDKLISFRHEDAYLEEPFGESLFPGANVVYSRVVVRNLENAGYTKSQSGIMVHEFYTSKDFPTDVKVSKLKHAGYNLPITIPFIGKQSFMNNGYSQGYTIILNDMSGKPKSVATYAYKSNFDPSVQPVSRMEYIYQTDPSNSKRLKNNVIVLDGNNETRTAKLGETHEFYVAQQENSSLGISGGLAVNVQVVGLVPLVTLFPSISYDEAMYRSVATTKVVYQTGILSEVRNYTDGSEIITKNLMYDAETGAPILTAVNNEHGKYIYNYNYPAHWMYDNMGSAYKNIRIGFVLNDGGIPDSFEADLPTGVDHDEVFVEGDELLIYNTGSNQYEHIFVTDVQTDHMFLEYGDGSVPSSLDGLSGKIIRSGRRNLQGITAGKMVMLGDEQAQALSNPFLPQILSLFNSLANDPTAYRQVTDGYAMDDVSLCPVTPPQQPNPDIVFADSIKFIDAGLPGNKTIQLRVYHNGSGSAVCQSNITYDNSEFDFLTDLENIQITAYDTATHELTFFNSTTGDYSEGDFGTECDWDCRTFKVLHADAMEFTEDGWTYNYADVGDPVGEGSAVIGNTPGLNVYRYGQRGIWRGKRSWVYQVDRDQNGSTPVFDTKADLDGEYNVFTEFNWADGISGNSQWDWTSEITKYSPYGFELESKNALGIYSSEMYGYGNSLVTAVGSNARYEEIAYDGFEDYGSTPTYSSHGHFDFDNGGTITINTSYAHTGKTSVTVTSGAPLVHTVDIDDSNVDYLEPLLNKRYQFSAWVRTESNVGSVTIALDGNTLLDIDTDDMSYEEIDGWTKLEGSFTMPQTVPSSGNFTITLGSTGTTYFDDVRVGPFNGGMKTFVYDPLTLWLMADLDNLNYATFYSYDEQGNLTVIKKETDRGIVTIQSSRQNVAQ